MVSQSDHETSFSLKALLRDERFWKIAFQVITVLVVVLLFAFFIGNLNRNLTQQGNAFGFGFLVNPAGFSIGESAIQVSAPRSLLESAHGGPFQYGHPHYRWDFFTTF
jgi:general L-amino acid transport system permease protein